MIIRLCSSCGFQWGFRANVSDWRPRAERNTKTLLMLKAFPLSLLPLSLSPRCDQLPKQTGAVMNVINVIDGISGAADLTPRARVQGAGAAQIYSPPSSSSHDTLSSAKTVELLNLHSLPRLKLRLRNRSRTGWIPCATWRCMNHITGNESCDVGNHQAASHSWQLLQSLQPGWEESTELWLVKTANWFAGQGRCRNEHVARECIV